MEHIKEHTPNASPVLIQEDTTSHADSFSDSTKSVLRRKVDSSPIAGKSEAPANHVKSDSNQQPDTEASSVGEESEPFDFQTDFDLHHARIQARIQELLYPDPPSNAEPIESCSGSAGNRLEASTDHAAGDNISTYTGDGLSGEAAGLAAFLDPVDRSPSAVLKGLIRDGHKSSMFFTLGDPRFSLELLLEGLEEAYITQQMALVQLALVSTLHDNLEGLSVTEVRKWTVRLQQLDPKTRFELKLPGFCYSLPRDVVKIAIIELVRSRVEVQLETLRVTERLMERVKKMEADDRKNAWIQKMRDEQKDESFVTLFMVISIGALYLCLSAS